MNALRATLFGTLAVLLGVQATATSQQPPPSHAPLEGGLTPEEISRLLQERLGIPGRGASDEELLRSLLDQVKDNPDLVRQLLDPSGGGPDPESVKRLLDANPDLRDPERLKQLQQYAQEQTGGMQGGGMSREDLERLQKRFGGSGPTPPTPAGDQPPSISQSAGEPNRWASVSAGSASDCARKNGYGWMPRGPSSCASASGATSAR